VPAIARWPRWRGLLATDSTPGSSFPAAKWADGRIVGDPCRPAAPSILQTSSETGPGGPRRFLKSPGSVRLSTSDEPGEEWQWP
jgi:hypothetical protein